MANQTVICTYRVRPDGEELFQALLGNHWPTLHTLGFVTDSKPVIFRSVDDPPTYVEIFTWVEGGFEQAHEHPNVLAIWEPMDPLLEDRQGLPRWEFPHYVPWQPPHR
ncbi:MAG: hypothetical protein M1493_06050 [Firmicutes bacterium]|nr:hypothetical protein [Bacillota bacterium]